MFDTTSLDIPPVGARPRPADALSTCLEMLERDLNSLAQDLAKCGLGQLRNGARALALIAGLQAKRAREMEDHAAGGGARA